MRNEKLLGDRVKSALEKLGITEDRVSAFIGRPCGCGSRRSWLNRLDLWARKVLSGNFKDARKYLKELEEEKK